MTKKKYNKKELRKSIQHLFTSNPQKSFSVKQIENTFKIKDKNLRKLALTILIEQKKEGFLKEKKRHVFVLNNKPKARGIKKDTFIGIVDATSKGHAYIIVEELEKDIFVRQNFLKRALDGDEVEVQLVKQTKNKIEGEVLRVIKRRRETFVGRLDIKKNYAFFLPDDYTISIHIFVPLKKIKNATSKDKVLVRITSWPKDKKSPYGEVIAIMGQEGDNDTEMQSILVKNEFSLDFPKEVLAEASKIGVDLDREEVKKRRDLREKLTFTIDPFNAKDFDDALSYEELENGHIEVGVHIADVSHFVRPGTAMDKEAQHRGNSVYLEDRVIPMLPENLSNVACSLRPNEDKYTFSALFELDQQGKVYKEWFGKTVIHSDRRYTYEEAQEIIEQKAEDNYQKEICQLNRMAQAMRKARIKAGALSIVSEEVSFILDEDGNPIGIKKKVQKEANKLIEEFMLLANKRVALFVGKIPNKKEANTNFIYRCHDDPDIEKLQTFSVFAKKFNYDLTFQNTKGVAKKINAFLDKIKDTPEHGIFQIMAIRSMSKADYRTHNIGHYGLGFNFYTHFTSPIRRYADLMVHRILQEKLMGRTKNYGNQLNEICKHISAQERKAIESERESNKFFQARFMKGQVGEVFEGTVSGLADFGMFVKMDETACEGMIRMKDLPDDNYYYDAEKFQIIGRQTKYPFNFGDKVTVRVNKVNLNRKEIDLTLVEEK